MTEAILHIGYPKSGSSALQTTLLASRVAPSEHGFSYPGAPRGLCNALTANFHHASETLFERIRIVCYVRHPIRYASSLVQERVKLG